MKETVLIKELTVNVKFTVMLSDVEVPAKVAESLERCAKVGEFNGPTGDLNRELSPAIDWINDNIKEDDCCDISYEIDELQV